jgi:8-hydroxy-5-deazaflavin:NADPH oxidoreductase
MGIIKTGNDSTSFKVDDFGLRPALELCSIIDAGEFIADGLTESRWVAQQLNRPVIKAFNNIYAEHLLKLGKPKRTPARIALPVAGDDPAAKGIILKLVDELGFEGVDAGTLDDSWRQQPATPVYCKDFDAEGVRRALSLASKERKPEWRGTAKSPGTTRPDQTGPH